MESAKIRELARLMHEEKLTCLTYKSGDESIHLECQGPAQVLPAQMATSNAGAATSFLNPEQSSPDAQKASAPTHYDAGQHNNLGMDFNDMNSVTSPLVGIFYAAPAEGQDPYVQVGDKVKQGDTLCIVEAMKVMNEIAATHDGEIVDICVRNGDVVEFGQPLFKLI